MCNICIIRHGKINNLLRFLGVLLRLRVMYYAKLVYCHAEGQFTYPPFFFNFINFFDGHRLAFADNKSVTLKSREGLCKHEFTLLCRINQAQVLLIWLEHQQNKRISKVFPCCLSFLSNLGDSAVA